MMIIMWNIYRRAIVLHPRHSPDYRKQSNKFHLYNGTKTVYAISLMPHASEDSSKRYYRHTPYISRIKWRHRKISWGSNTSGAVSSKETQDVYVHVKMELCLRVTGIMDEVESVVIWWVAVVLDCQTQTILQHLRYKSNGHITVLITTYWIFLNDILSQEPKWLNIMLTEWRILK